MNVSVRRATLDDAAALYEAWQELRSYNASVDARIIPSPVSETEFRAGLEALLARPTSVLFVAEAAEDLLGFIRAGVEPNMPDRLPEQHVGIGYLFVRPAARRKGVGRRLFEEVRRWADSQEGVAHFEMTVLNADAQAEAFWRSLGFSPFIQRLWAPMASEDAS